MKMRWLVMIGASIMPILAHHSVQGEYDVSKTITVQGVVTKVEWMNPHAHFWVEAKNEDGSVSNWEMELPSPNSLIKENVTKDFVKSGDLVTVNVWAARDGSKLAHALTLTLPDGRVMNFPKSWMMPANTR